MKLPVVVKGMLVFGMLMLIQMAFMVLAVSLLFHMSWWQVMTDSQLAIRIGIPFSALYSSFVMTKTLAVRWKG